MQSNIFLQDLKKRGRSVEWLVVELVTCGIKISYSTVYKKLRGDSEFTASEIKAISNVMNYSDEKMIDIFFSDLVS